GERSIEHRVREEAPDAFTVHDERQPGGRVLRIHRRRVVRDVTDPGRPVPLDARTLRVPWLPVEVRRRAVVEDPSVHWPAPRPLREETHAGRVVLLDVLDPVPSLHAVAG